MINQELRQAFKEKYEKDPTNRASQHAIHQVGIQEASLNADVRRQHPFAFSEETKRGKITDQKSSGRCWMFSALNTARVHVMEKLNLESFEFSQNYTLFWDKLEKANYFLNSIIETADRDLNDRLIWHLLQAPQEDGGQWEMFAGILNKYGSVPKEVMPESFHSSNTRLLNETLNNKLREFAYELRQAAQAGQSQDDLAKKRDQQLYFVYQLLVKALGPVPEVFDYSYRDKDGNYHKLQDLTPQSFFQDYGGIETEDMVSLINAPTQDKPYGKTFTVDYLGTIAEEKPIKYLNAPIDVLKEAAIAAIKDGVPVWFGCDVGKSSYSKWGIMDTDLFDYEATLGDSLNLSKEARLDYGVSVLTHAMVLVGVDLDADGQAINWKVENSWGKKVGDDGIFSMSDKWFDEYNYQITLPSRYLPSDWQGKYDQEPIHLAPWDPMGSLAKHQ
ncbi:aminopeptidase C [Aerococcus sanguinicola]